MALPPVVSENIERFYGADSIYRPYAFAATFFFFLFLKRDSRRAGVIGFLCTIVAFYVVGFVGDAFIQFAPPIPQPAKARR
ncbi:hypothetical protein [Armatimonas sp.]|uniref:hypothetical protein n=1 Tax=Armatimonas sp. TaxID=1872638 RepID=UPI00375180D8